MATPGFTDKVKVALEKKGYVERPQKDGRYFVFVKEGSDILFYVSSRGHLRVGFNLEAALLYTRSDVLHFINTGNFC